MIRKKHGNVELDIMSQTPGFLCVYSTLFNCTMLMRIIDVCYLQDILPNISAMAWARVKLVKTTVKLYSGNTH